MVNGYDLIYNWFDHLKDNGHHITGYVVMPNHVHATIAFKKSNQAINTIIGNGKRFIGYDIIKRLTEDKQELILQQLASAVTASDRRRNEIHEVWENSFDWKDCLTTEFIEQKLNYMHNNPCTGKWQLANSPVEYAHSSARYYITGEQGNYPVTNYMNLQDIDLNK